ncbi:hypothetical protein SJAG_04809 [Schizosaccharomyces japonicus yFS275]|uniref:Uncharacterized protein n=1 Tax=Schizosaccharomyces japonicus (strain yFS275 / FY16936) TaxID=402676 RepID=B6K7T8_SCHJY|nr:hypothetical protein SJAG_04809 [Schizosaccharomyces japonicus yFS275]EEB09592.1 hypothetical protein SJAG_04809 [Schizosaccharomyces japonicus yFS275]
MAIEALKTKKRAHSSCFDFFDEKRLYGTVLQRSSEVFEDGEALASLICTEWLPDLVVRGEKLLTVQDLHYLLVNSMPVFSQLDPRRQAEVLRSALEMWGYMWGLNEEKDDEIREQGCGAEASHDGTFNCSSRASLRVLADITNTVDSFSPVTVAPEYPISPTSSSETVEEVFSWIDPDEDAEATEEEDWSVAESMIRLCQPR